MKVRMFKAMRRKVSAWFRRSGQTPRGRLYSGNHTASDRSFSRVQLMLGRRPYLLYLPENYSPEKRLPMIVMMHGCKQDAQMFAAATRMNGLADRDNFIVLYPEQRRFDHPYRCWNWYSGSAQQGRGEVAALADMIRSLADEHNVDPARIYIAGLSAGASMAANMVVCHADLFSACALHSGLMFEAATSAGEALSSMRNGSRHDPEKTGRHAFALARGKTDAMPALVIHGDGDRIVNPLNADQLVAQFDLLNALLAEKEGQQGKRVQTQTTSSRSASAHQFETIDYRHVDRLLLRKVTILGMGHAWSGGVEDYEYNDPEGPCASELICDFFAEHGLRDAVRSHVAASA